MTEPSLPDVKLEAVISEAPIGTDYTFFAHLQNRRQGKPGVLHPGMQLEHISSCCGIKGLELIFHGGGHGTGGTAKGLTQIQERSHRLLITTDLASRGLDIEVEA